MGLFRPEWYKQFEYWLLYAYQESSKTIGYPYKEINPKDVVEVISIICGFKPQDFSNIQLFGEFYLSDPPAIDGVLSRIHLDEKIFNQRVLQVGPGVLTPLLHTLPLLLISGNYSKWSIRDRFDYTFRFFLKHYGSKTLYLCLQVIEDSGFSSSFYTILQIHKYFKKDPETVQVLSSWSLWFVTDCLLDSFRKLKRTVVSSDFEMFWKDTFLCSRYNYQKDKIREQLISTCTRILPQMENQFMQIFLTNQQDFNQMLQQFDNFYEPYRQDLKRALDTPHNRLLWESYRQEPMEIIYVDKQSYTIFISLIESLKKLNLRLAGVANPSERQKDSLSASKQLIELFSNFKSEINIQSDKK